MSKQPDPGGETKTTERDWYLVKLSVPWVVNGVDGVQDAINIAISEVGRRIEDASHTRGVDLDVQMVSCPNQTCGTVTEAVLLVAEKALVGLRVEANVRAKDPDHSRQVACRELGKHLEDAPLEPVEVTQSSFDT